MTHSFLAAAVTTLLFAYLGRRCQAMWAVLFIVLTFFMLLLSLALAPNWVRTLILVAGLGWALLLCRNNQCQPN